MRRAIAKRDEVDVDKAALFGYPAGKARIADQLVALIPTHKTYVEPFCGSAAVFVTKSPSEVEVLNDVDEELAVALKTIGTLSDSEVSKLESFDWRGSVETYKRIVDSKPTGKVGKLYRFLYLSKFSRLKARGRGFEPTYDGGTTRIAQRVNRYRKRFAKAKIFSGDFREMVKRFDGPDTFFFFDPPYLGTRAEIAGVRDFDEEGFSKLLKTIKGKFLVTYAAKHSIDAKGFVTKKIVDDKSRGFPNQKGVETELIMNYQPTKKRDVEEVIELYDDGVEPERITRLKSTIEKKRSLKSIAIEAGPPNEWSGGVASVLGPDLRKQVTDWWAGLSKTERKRAMAEFEASFEKQDIGTGDLSTQGGLLQPAVSNPAIFDEDERRRRRQKGEGGTHWHKLDRPGKTTLEGGAHSHLFMIDGRIIGTEFDGVHTHKLAGSDADETKEDGKHVHSIRIGERFLKTGDSVSAHSHELQVDGTVHDGLHKHTLKIGDQTIESLTPGEFAEALASQAERSQIFRARTDDPLFDLPKEEKGARSVWQFHTVDKRLHLDVRMDVGSHLVGWTIGNARGGEVAKASDAKFTLRGDRFTKSLRGALACEPKHRQPTEWFDVTGDEITKVDEPDVEFGIQTSDVHEYFFSKGAVVAGRLVCELGERWTARLDESCIPFVLSKRAVDDAIMPPDGRSALPESLRKCVPQAFRFWLAKGDEARAMRDALVASDFFNESNVRLVGGEFARVVTKVFLYEPDDDKPAERGEWTDEIAKRLEGVKLEESFGSIRKSEGVAYFDVGKVSPDDVGSVLDEVSKALGAGTSFVLSGIDSPHTRAIFAKVGTPFRLPVTDVESFERIFVSTLPIAKAAGLTWIDEVAIAKGAVAFKTYPGNDDPWDADAAIKRLREWASSDGTGSKDSMNWAKYRSAFAWFDQSDVENFGSYKLPHHDIRGGRVVTVRAAVSAALGALSGARGGVSIPASDVAAVRSHLERHRDELSKSDDDDTDSKLVDEVLAKHLPIVKADETKGDERFVFGIVLEPETVDSQNDIISADSIRETAHKFMSDFQNMGFMHKQLVNAKVRILESFLAPSKFKAGGREIKKGTWLLAVRVVDDDLWLAVKKGDLTGFSIGGSALRIPER